MLYLSVTVLSVLEVLLLLVPALLSVAFVTIAERKTMASMQRRLGPNSVGYYGLKKLDFYSKRFYHYYSSNDKNAIDALYRNRKVPVRPFEEKVINVCKDLLSPWVPKAPAAIKTLKGITLTRRSFYSSSSAVSYTTQSFSCCNPF
jgi:hypothetical protein